MKSFTQSIELLQSMTKVPTSDTVQKNLLTQWWNDSVRTVCSIRSGKWWFLQTIRTIATVVNSGTYPIPSEIRKIIDIYVTVGSTVYRPIPVFSPEKWNDILASQLGSSDVPQFYFIQGNQIMIEPKSSSTTGIINVRGRKSIPDLTVDDISSITVVTATNGSPTLTINAGGLSQMVGRYIRITDTGVANSGDGLWYEIASATATSIILSAPYSGISIVAGTTVCTVSQMSPIPSAYDMAPIYRALALYYVVNDPTNSRLFNTYWRLYDGGQEAGLSISVGGLIGQMLESEGESIEGPYISPVDIGEYGDLDYQSRQLATGF